MMDSPSDWKIGWILSPIWILSIMGISEQPNVQVKNDETRKAGTYWDIWDKAETSGCQLKDRIFKWHRRQFRIATSTSSLIHIFSEVGFMPYRMLRTITYPYLTRQGSGWDLNQTVKDGKKTPRLRTLVGLPQAGGSSVHYLSCPLDVRHQESQTLRLWIWAISLHNTFALIFLGPRKPTQ